MNDWRAACRTVSLLAVGLLWTGAATPAWGQDADSTALDDMTAEVASQLRCPVCRNQSVLESSSAVAREMQRLIRDKLAAGESPEAVTEYFVGKYGEWVLLRPEPSGMNLLIYLLPLAAVVLGAGVLHARVRRWVRAGTISRAGAFPVVAVPSQAVDSVSATENEISGGLTARSARLSAENERWLEEVLRE